jgi:carbon starvation protein CstA
MKTRAKLLISYKLLFALLGFAAIISEIAVISERGNFNPVNFFSFFTVQNNLIAVVALILGAITLASDKRSRGIDLFRGFATVFMIVVGIGFALLLAGLEGVALTAVPWNNTVLHYIMPIVITLDFLIDRPRTRFSFKKNLLWLLYPAAYFGYTMIRGAQTGWYPYPFLNPANNSVTSLVVTITGLFVLGTVLIWLAGLVAGRKNAR